jgi:signal transduction histidine kinase
MTIKERLSISNTLMIIVPVVFTAIIACACLEIVWLTMVNGNDPGGKDSHNFEKASHKTSAITETILKQADPDEQAKQFTKLEEGLNENSLSLIVSTSGVQRYHFGKEAEANLADSKLLAAMTALNGEGIVSSNGHQYYAHQTEIDGTLYSIHIFGKQAEVPPRSLDTVIILCGIIIILGISLSVLFTNKFLIKFVFQKIERPLDILTNGVRQIRDGNLDYRIQYDQQDEFTPVCADFNDMAVRLKELLAGISHDLRSPLTSIRAYVEGLLDGVARTPEAQRTYLETIKTKAIDIDQMVAKIFQLSKMEIDECLDHPEPLNLAEEIKTLIHAVSSEYKEKGLEVTAQDLLPVKVLADPDFLRRILVNILENSLKYKNKAMGHLTISLHSENACVILALSDDGPGVPEESLPRIFEAFYRNDPARQNPHKGSGLGLAIVSKAVSQMGGAITAKNGKSGGLTIEIQLPIQENKV